MQNSDFTKAAETVFSRLAEGSGTPPPWESLAENAPVLGDLTQFAIGHVLGRDVVPLLTRELCIVSVLASLGGADSQLRFHLEAARRLGASFDELAELLTQVAVYAGIPRAINAVAVLQHLLADTTDTA